MKWIIGLLDFRLWNGGGGGGGGGQGGGGQGGGGQGGGGQGGGGAGSGGPDQGGGGEGGYGSHRSDREWATGGLGGGGWGLVKAETKQYGPPAPEAPPEEPGLKTEASYARALEDVRQRNRGAASMPAYAQDYSIPDTAFGSRIY